MTKNKNIVLPVLATAAISVVAVAGVIAPMSNAAAQYVAGTCVAVDEESLTDAIADDACPEITLNKSEIQDRGIQLTKDFDGEGKTLILGDSSYGLLVDTYGLDGSAGSPATGVVISNVILKAAAGSKGLININDVPVVLKNVTTDRSASSNYFAHINVKKASSLTLNNYEAKDGNIVIDYSPAAENSLVLNMDKASMTNVASVPCFVSADTTAEAIITAYNAAVLDFLNSDDVILYKDSERLEAADKQGLVSAIVAAAPADNLPGNIPDTGISR